MSMANCYTSKYPKLVGSITQPAGARTELLCSATTDPAVYVGGKSYDNTLVNARITPIYGKYDYKYSNKWSYLYQINIGGGVTSIATNSIYPLIVALLVTSGQNAHFLQISADSGALASEVVKIDGFVRYVLLENSLQFFQYTEQAVFSLMRNSYNTPSRLIDAYDRIIFGIYDFTKSFSQGENVLPFFRERSVGTNGRSPVVFVHGSSYPNRFYVAGSILDGTQANIFVDIWEKDSSLTTLTLDASIKVQPSGSNQQLTVECGTSVDSASDRIYLGVSYLDFDANGARSVGIMRVKNRDYNQKDSAIYWWTIGASQFIVKAIYGSSDSQGFVIIAFANDASHSILKTRLFEFDLQNNQEKIRTAGRIIVHGQQYPAHVSFNPENEGLFSIVGYDSEFQKPDSTMHTFASGVGYVITSYENDFDSDLCIKTDSFNSDTQYWNLVKNDLNLDLEDGTADYSDSDLTATLVDQTSQFTIHPLNFANFVDEDWCQQQSNPIPTEADIDIVTIPAQTYTVGDNTLSFSIQYIFIEQTHCRYYDSQLFTYVVDSPSEIQVTDQAVQINAANNQLQIYTDNPNYIGVHTITVGGFHQTGTYVKTSFQLTIKEPCIPVITVVSELQDQTYTLGSSAVTYSFARAFSVNDPPCTLQYSYNAIKDGTSSGSYPWLIQLDSQTQVFTFYNNHSPGMDGIYEIIVYAFVTQYDVESQMFTLTVIDPCKSATLSYIGDPTQFIDYTYEIGNPVDHTFSWNYDTSFSSSETTIDCDNFWAEMQTPLIDTQVFSTSSSSGTVTTSTSNVDKVGTYNLVFQFSYDDQEYRDILKQEIHYTATLVNLCNGPSLSLGTQTPTDYTLKQDDSLVYDTSNLVTLTPDYCTCSMSFTSVPSPGITPPFFTLDSNSGQFTIDDNGTYNSALAGSYEITLQLDCGIPTVTTKTTVFTQTVIDPCLTAVISETGSSSADTNYQMMGPYQEGNIFSFIEITPGFCPFSAISYTATKDGVTDPYSNLFTFDSTDGTFRVDDGNSYDSSLAGTYAITFTFEAGPVTKTVNHNIEVIDPCDSLTLTHAPIPDEDYQLMINSPTAVQIDTMSSIALDPNYCDITNAFIAEKDGVSGAYASLFTFQIDGNLDINDGGTYQQNLAGSYNVRVTYTAKTETTDIEFVVTVIDPCDTVTITSSSLLESQTYNLLDESSEYDTASTFTVSQPFCELTALSYLASKDDGENDPYADLLTFDSNFGSADFGKMVVYDQSIYIMELAGIYTITIKAEARFAKQEYSFELTVIDPCEVLSTASDPIPESTFTDGDGDLPLTFTEFTYTVNIEGCVYDWTYTATLADGSPLPDENMVFDDTSKTINVSGSVPTTVSYEIKVKGALSDLASNQQEFTFLVHLVAAEIPFSVALNTAPTLTPPPMDIDVYEPGTISISSEVVDLEEDNVQVVCEVPVAASFFLSCNEDPLEITVDLVDDTSLYTSSEITVTLTDDNEESPQSNKYSFKVNIVDPPQEEEEEGEGGGEEEQQEEENDEEGTQFAGVVIGQEEEKEKRREEFKIEYEQPYFFIQDITPKGLVYISCTKKLIIPSDWQERINSTVLELKIEMGEEQLPENILFDWNITRFDPLAVELFLDFQNPILISTALTFDKLKIKMLEPNLFMDYEFQVTDVNTTLTEKIPRQLKLGAAAQALEAVGESLEGGSKALVMGNLAINLILSGSLAMLWNMINALQLIVHVPMLNVNMPGNAVMLFQAIQSIANFQVIPTEELINSVFKFNESEAANEQVGEMGYDSTNMLQNLGILLVGLVLLLLLVGVVLLVRWAFKKYQKLRDMFNNIWRNIFWNSFIRYFLEAYFELAISSMLNMQALVWNNFSECLSSAMAVGTITGLALSPFAMYRFLSKRWDKNLLVLSASRAKYGALYMNLYLRRKAPIMSNPAFCLRRFLLALSAIYASFHGFAQIQVLLFLTSLVVIFNGLAEPFIFKHLFFLEIFNECCIIIVGYHLISFTDFVEDKETQYLMGYSICGITVFNVFVNISALFIKQIGNMIQKCKYKKLEKKVNKARIARGLKPIKWGQKRPESLENANQQKAADAKDANKPVTKSKSLTKKKTKKLNKQPTKLPKKKTKMTEKKTATKLEIIKEEQPSIEVMAQPPIPPRPEPTPAQRLLNEIERDLLPERLESLSEIDINDFIQNNYNSEEGTTTWAGVSKYGGANQSPNRQKTSKSNNGFDLDDFIERYRPMLNQQQQPREQDEQIESLHMF